MRLEAVAEGERTQMLAALAMPGMLLLAAAAAGMLAAGLKFGPGSEVFEWDCECDCECDCE